MGQSGNSSQNHIAGQQNGDEAEKVCKEPHHEGLIWACYRKKRLVLDSDQLCVMLSLGGHLQLCQRHGCTMAGKQAEIILPSIWWENKGQSLTIIKE